MLRATAGLKPRQRESTRARPHKRLHVELTAVEALAARFAVSAILTAVDTACDDAPAEGIRLAEGVGSHDNRMRTGRVESSPTLQLTRGALHPPSLERDQ
jgi:hypothetical protein